MYEKKPSSPVRSKSVGPFERLRREERRRKRDDQHAQMLQRDTQTYSRRFPVPKDLVRSTVRAEARAGGRE
jgi:hypothetical protein